MKNGIIKLSPFIFIIALVGDFVVTFFLGLFYEGYSHVSMVMSELGSPRSPVAMWMAFYWVFYGLAMILFGYSFIQIFRQAPAGASTGFLIILVGIGNGLCSAFPMDPPGANATLFGKLHDIGSGTGFLLMFVMSILLLRFFSSRKNLAMLIFLVGVQIFVVAISVYLLALAPGSESGLSVYIGLWQRLYLASYYGVFILLARKMRVENARFLVDQGGYAASTITKPLAKKGETLAAAPEGSYVTGEQGPLKGSELERAAVRAEQCGAAPMMLIRDAVRWKTRLFYGVYSAAYLGLVLYGMLVFINPQVLTDSFSAHVYQFPPGDSSALTYLAALFRLLGFFNLLVGSLGLQLLWRYRRNPQPWIMRTAMGVALLAYLAPIIFDNTVGRIGSFEILEHILFVTMLAAGIVYFIDKDSRGY